MILRVIVKLLGGWWNLRNRYAAAHLPLAKRVYQEIYTAYLQTMGSSIPLSTRFAGAPVFPHGPFGVFVSGGAQIGKNCVIFQHVVIGSNSLADSRGLGAPVVGDSCYIGSGAKVIGKAKVGNNVRIGANAVVYKDVPDNCVVTSGAQRVIAKAQSPNNKFYHRFNDQWRCFDDGTWVTIIDPVELSALDHAFPPDHAT